MMTSKDGVLAERLWMVGHLQRAYFHVIYIKENYTTSLRGVIYENVFLENYTTSARGVIYESN